MLDSLDQKHVPFYSVAIISPSNIRKKSNRKIKKVYIKKAPSIKSDDDKNSYEDDDDSTSLIVYNNNISHSSQKFHFDVLVDTTIESLTKKKKKISSTTTTTTSTTTTIYNDSITKINKQVVNQVVEAICKRRSPGPGVDYASMIWLHSCNQVPSWLCTQNNEERGSTPVTKLEGRNNNTTPPSVLTTTVKELLTRSSVKLQDKSTLYLYSSAFEVYNNEVYDLFTREKLAVFGEDAVIPGLSSRRIRNTAEWKRFFRRYWDNLHSRGKLTVGSIFFRFALRRGPNRVSKNNRAHYLSPAIHAPSISSQIVHDMSPSLHNFPRTPTNFTRVTVPTDTKTSRGYQLTPDKKSSSVQCKRKIVPGESVLDIVLIGVPVPSTTSITPSKIPSRAEGAVRRSLMNLGLMIDQSAGEVDPVGLSWRSFKLTQLLSRGFIARKKNTHKQTSVKSSPSYTPDTKTKTSFVTLCAVLDPYDPRTVSASLWICALLRSAKKMSLLSLNKGEKGEGKGVTDKFDDSNYQLKTPPRNQTTRRSLNPKTLPHLPTHQPKTLPRIRRSTKQSTSHQHSTKHSTSTKHSSISSSTTPISKSLNETESHDIALSGDLEKGQQSIRNKTIISELQNKLLIAEKSLEEKEEENSKLRGMILQLTEEITSKVEMLDEVANKQNEHHHLILADTTERINTLGDTMENLKEIQRLHIEEQKTLTKSNSKNKTVKEDIASIVMGQMDQLKSFDEQLLQLTLQMNIETFLRNALYQWKEDIEGQRRSVVELYNQYRDECAVMMQEETTHPSISSNKQNTLELFRVLTNTIASVNNMLEFPLESYMEQLRTYIQH